MTSIAVSFRDGTEEDHENFVGVESEITVNTTKKTVVVHDGITPGGSTLASEVYVDNKFVVTPNLFLQPVMGVSYSDCTLVGDGGLDVTLPIGSRFLVRSQTEPTENGVYITGEGSWLRASDFVDDAHLLNGMLVVNTSEQDGLNVNVFIMTFSGEYVVGTTELSFTQLRFI